MRARLKGDVYPGAGIKLSSFWPKALKRQAEMKRSVLAAVAFAFLSSGVHAQDLDGKSWIRLSGTVEEKAGATATVYVDQQTKSMGARAFLVSFVLVYESIQHDPHGDYSRLSAGIYLNCNTNKHYQFSSMDFQDRSGATVFSTPDTDPEEFTAIDNRPGSLAEALAKHFC